MSVSLVVGVMVGFLAMVAFVVSRDLDAIARRHGYRNYIHMVIERRRR